MLKIRGAWFRRRHPWRTTVWRPPGSRRAARVDIRDYRPSTSLLLLLLPCLEGLAAPPCSATLCFQVRRLRNHLPGLALRRDRTTTLAHVLVPVPEPLACRPTARLAHCR